MAGMKVGSVCPLCGRLSDIETDLSEAWPEEYREAIARGERLKLTCFPCSMIV
jgi:hypothetical protein